MITQQENNKKSYQAISALLNREQLIDKLEAAYLFDEYHAIAKLNKVEN